MDPHEAQGSKDISFEESNSNDDPAQGSNDNITTAVGKVQSLLRVALPIKLPEVRINAREVFGHRWS